MKKIFSLCLILLFISGTSLSAQSTAPVEAEIKSVLCFKWQVKGRYLFGQQISKGDDIRYEFFSNNTFKKTTGNKTETGSWSFETEGSLVRLKLNNQPDSWIRNANEKEFEFLASLEGNPGGMVIMYKRTE